MRQRLDAFWQAPHLCGCVLKINGEWVHEGVLQPDGTYIQYAFPARQENGQTSIISMSIVNVCPLHTTWQTDPLPSDPYNGCAGYLDIPNNPTPAEKLFIRFFSQNVTLLRPDTCECAVTILHDRKSGFVKHLDHPKHSKKCARHQNDVNHVAAIADNKLKADILNSVQTQLPTKFYSKLQARQQNERLANLVFGAQFNASGFNDDELLALLPNLPTASENDMQPGFSVAVTFAMDGSVNVTPKGLTVGEKNQLSMQLNTLHGQRIKVK